MSNAKLDEAKQLASELMVKVRRFLWGFPEDIVAQETLKQIERDYLSLMEDGEYLTETQLDWIIEDMREGLTMHPEMDKPN